LAGQQPTIGSLDAVTLQETAELEGAEADIPDAVVDFFEAHVVTGTDGRPASGKTDE